MPLDACPPEHELLARAQGAHRRETTDSGEVDAFEEHLAECSECRVVLSELARVSTGPRDTTPQDMGGNAPGAEEVRLGSGDVIGGKYRIDAVLGRGGMGLVLGATHEVLGSRVAIKVPALQVLDDPQALARMLREARVVARLEGEYVGRVLDAGVLPGGFPFVVFEHLSGKTLAERLRDEGSLSVADAVDVVLEACAGLSVAHAAGIVHRDVKPSNLFEARRADGSTTVRVIDFGIARPLAETEALTRSRVVLGTPAYMAPEQGLASRTADARADVWALGVTLLELVTGCLPTPEMAPTRTEADDAPLSRAIQAAGAARRDALSLARVVGRCLRDRPDERYPSVAALASALAPLAGPRGQTALRSIQRTGDALPGRHRPRRAVGAVVLGVGLCLLGAAGTLAVTSSRSASAPPPSAPSASPPAAPTLAAVSTDPAPRALLPQPQVAPETPAPSRRAAAAASSHRVSPKPLPQTAPQTLPQTPPQTPPPPASAPLPHDANGLDDRK